MKQLERTAEACSLCRSVRLGRAYEFYYGKRSRGTNPLTLQEDATVLGNERCFVCDRCTRRSLGRAISRVVKYSAATAVVSLLVHLGQRLSSGGLVGDPTEALYLFLLASAGTLVGTLLTQFHWHRTHRLEQELFEARRASLAKDLALKPADLDSYTAEQARNAAA